MTGIAFSRRNRRSKLYLAVLADLAGLKPAAHLAPVQTPYQPFESKADRHRAASEHFRRTGAP